jgi:hypothetical protein
VFFLSFFAELLERLRDLFAAVCGIGLTINAVLRPRRPQCGLPLLGFDVARKVGINKNMNETSGRQHGQAYDHQRRHRDGIVSVP